MDYHLSNTLTAVVIVVAIWELSWKAAALWRAAHNEERTWFVILLLINSVGILPILYLYFTKPAKDV